MYIINRANEHLYRNDTDNPLRHGVLTLLRGLNILFHKMYNKANWSH